MSTMTTTTAAVPTGRTGRRSRSSSSSSSSRDRGRRWWSWSSPSSAHARRMSMVSLWLAWVGRTETVMGASVARHPTGGGVRRGGSDRRLVSPRDSHRRHDNVTYLAIGQDLFSIQEYLTAQYNYSLHHPSLPSDAELLSTSLRHHHSWHRTINPWQAFAPAAYMVYTDIQSLRGLETPIDYGSGVEYANGLFSLIHAEPPQSSSSSSSHNHIPPPPPPGLQIGLWLNGTQGCRDIVWGRLDRQITRLVHYVSRAPASVVILRIGYEFDNPQFGYYHPYELWSSSLSAYPCRNGDGDCVARANAVDLWYYREAYRIISHACTRQSACRAKVIRVWHSWAAGLRADSTPVANMGRTSHNDNDHHPTTDPHPDPYASSVSSSSSSFPTATVTEVHPLTLHDFYPGDEYVDWVGVSLFRQFEADDDVVAPDTTRPPPPILGIGDASTVQDVVDFARRHDKPLMIAESTPFGGLQRGRRNRNAPTPTTMPNVEATPVMNDHPWERWFAPVLDFIDANNVIMWSYINCDWDAQPLWHHVGFGDTRLSTNETVMDLWHRQVVQKARFRDAGTVRPPPRPDVDDNPNDTPSLTTDTELRTDPVSHPAAIVISRHESRLWSASFLSISWLKSETLPSQWESLGIMGLSSLYWMGIFGIMVIFTVYRRHSSFSHPFKSQDQIRNNHQPSDDNHTHVNDWTPLAVRFRTDYGALG